MLLYTVARRTLPAPRVAGTDDDPSRESRRCRGWTLRDICWQKLLRRLSQDPAELAVEVSPAVPEILRRRRRMKAAADPELEAVDDGRLGGSTARGGRPALENIRGRERCPSQEQFGAEDLRSSTVDGLLGCGASHRVLLVVGLDICPSGTFGCSPGNTRACMRASHSSWPGPREKQTLVVEWSSMRSLSEHTSSNRINNRHARSIIYVTEVSVLQISVRSRCKAAVVTCTSLSLSYKKFTVKFSHKRGRAPGRA